MEFITEASEWIHKNNYLTPHEKSIILARLQIKQFASAELCLIWCRDTAIDLVQSNRQCNKYRSDMDSIYE